MKKIAVIIAVALFTTTMFAKVKEGKIIITNDKSSKTLNEKYLPDDSNGGIIGDTKFYETPYENTDSLTHIESAENTINIISLYPNPANTTVNINYSVSKDMNVNIALYNTLGAKIVDVINKPHSKGEYNFELNLSSLPSGVYMCKMTMSGSTIVKRLIIS